MNRVIGIDLGTTNTVVSAIVRGEPVIVETMAGSTLTRTLMPSVVCYDTKYSKTFMVGRDAKDQAKEQPENVAYSVKRLMGMHYFEEEEEKYHAENQRDREKFLEVKRKVGYRLTADPTGKDEGVRILLGEDAYLTPVEISGKILSAARQAAERFLNETVSGAVITVPAWFEPKQIEATRRAGELAGLKVLEILDEPSATAYASAHGHVKETRRTLVYDLGGGTFDVSLVMMREGRLRGESLGGDNWLGGDNFDDELIALVAEHIEKLYKHNPIRDREFRSILKPIVEQAKIALSERDHAMINAPNCCRIPTGSGNVKPVSVTELKITRLEFERRIKKYLDSTLRVVEKVIADSERDRESIHEVLLVGGPTYTLCLREAICERFPGKVRSADAVHPMHCVAQGAAIRAEEIKTAVGTGRVTAGQGVLPYSIGVKVRQGRNTDVFAPLIPRGTRLPMKAPLTRDLAVAKADRLLVAVYVGDDARASENRHQGNIDLDLSSNPAAPGTPVSIGLLLTRDRILQVTIAVRDRETVVKDLEYTEEPDPKDWCGELAKTIPMVDHYLTEYGSYIAPAKVAELKELVARAELAVEECNRIECKVLEKGLLRRLLHEDEIANLLFKGEHLQRRSELNETIRAKLGAVCHIAKQTYRADRSKSTERTKDDLAEAKRELEVAITIAGMSLPHERPGGEEPIPDLPMSKEA